MWDPPRPGIEPVSPALAGGLLTTAPPGKSQECFFSIRVLAQLDVIHPLKKKVGPHIPYHIHILIPAGLKFLEGNLGYYFSNHADS